MSKSLNQCNFIGNLGANPEKFVTKNGNNLVKISIAINNKKDGKDNTIWVDVLTFNNTGEFVHQYLKKGDKVFVSGELTIQNRKTEADVEYKSFAIMANQVIIVSSKDNNQPIDDENNQSVKQILDDEIPF